jgi:hypothetical protein
MKTQIKWMAILLVSLPLFTGCLASKLIPKTVEFGQKKVEEFPKPTDKYDEVQREAALRAEETAGRTYAAAVFEDSSTNVVAPARETVALTRAVSESLGPPLTPSKEPSEILSGQLLKEVAKLNARIDTFSSRNDSLEGKKIEGTGALQIPYFAYVLIVGAFFVVLTIVVAIAWAFIKTMALTNPPLAAGVGAVTMGASLAKRALSEVVKGGEEFKSLVGKEISDSGLKQKILDMFRTSQQIAQSQDTQTAVKVLTV